MDKSEIVLILNKTSEKVDSLRGSFDPAKLQLELDKLETQLQDPEIWKDHKKTEFP